MLIYKVSLSAGTAQDVFQGNGYAGAYEIRIRPSSATNVKLGTASSAPSDPWVFPSVAEYVFEVKDTPVYLYNVGGSAESAHVIVTKKH
jgi:hypothetical protein